jgi:hypothetical protein
MKHRLKRLANDALGLGALVLLLAALIFLTSVFMRLRVEWCVAAGGDRATCAAVSTLSGRR